MEFKLLVIVNLCTRNIIQNEGQGISKAPALFLNKNKIMHCFPKFQVYKHIASKMRLSEIIVDWEISCLRADDHLVHAHLSHCLRGLPLWFALNYFIYFIYLFNRFHLEYNTKNEGRRCGTHNRARLQIKCALTENTQILTM